LSLNLTSFSFFFLSSVVGTADDLTGQAVYAFGSFLFSFSISSRSLGLDADDPLSLFFLSSVAMKPEFDFKAHKEADLLKELTLQVRKVSNVLVSSSSSPLRTRSDPSPFFLLSQVIGPFAAPKGIFLVPDLPKTRSGKIMRRVLRKIVAGEGDQLGDLSTLADPSVVDAIKEKVGKR